MFELPLADTAPWTLWIPFIVFFLGVVIAALGAWLSRHDADS